jgi:hypothetical protein
LFAIAFGASEGDGRARKSKSQETSRAAPAVAAKPPAAAPAVKVPAAEPRSIVLSLSANRATFVPGDTVEFAVRADSDCHLTLISIDTAGLATVLFPNDFERENRIGAGETLRVPDANAPYRLRLDKPGVETVLAICTGRARRPRGIGHDFERSRFTILGDWNAFTGAIEAREREVQRKIADENRKRLRRRKPAESQIADPPPGEREAEGRALMLLAVEGGLSPPTARAP